MSLDGAALLTILGMAVATYATRIAGYLVARRLARAGPWTAVLEAVPPAVLAAVIAPAVLTRGPADALAALVTAVAATRLPLLATVLIGMGAVVTLRGWLPPP
jgi:uncharacterized membrane protein